MLRPLSGFKAQYQDLTFVVVSEFDEWKVLVCGPQVTLHGSRQFSEAKAKAHAVEITQKYLEEARGAPPAAVEVEWRPTDHDDWLIWRA